MKQSVVTEQVVFCCFIFSVNLFNFTNFYPFRIKECYDDSRKKSSNINRWREITMKNKKQLWELFWVFFKMSPVTFGGGYAMIPIIEREVVFHKKWLNMDDVSDTLALAGTAPGAIAVNSSIFIGFRVAGIMGAIAAMLGALIPTFVIVVTLGSLYLYFQDNTIVNAAFKGIGGAIVALITYAAIKISKTAIMDKSTAVLAIVMFIGMLVFQLHPLLVIFLGALSGIVIIKIKEKFGVLAELDQKEKHKSQAC